MNVFSFGIGEMALIFVVGVIVIGPDRLPEVFRFLGRQYGKLMRASQDLRRAFMMEADRADAEYRSEQLKIRREEAKLRLAKQLKEAQSGSNVPVSSGVGSYIPFDADENYDPHLHGNTPLPEEQVDPSREYDPHLDGNTLLPENHKQPIENAKTDTAEGGDAVDEQTDRANDNLEPKNEMEGPKE